MGSTISSKYLKVSGVFVKLLRFLKRCLNHKISNKDANCGSFWSEILTWTLITYNYQGCFLMLEMFLWCLRYFCDRSDVQLSTVNLWIFCGYLNIKDDWNYLDLDLHLDVFNILWNSLLFTKPQIIFFMYLIRNFHKVRNVLNFFVFRFYINKMKVCYF